MRIPDRMKSNGFATASIFVGASAAVAWAGWPLFSMITGHVARGFAMLGSSGLMMPLYPIFAIGGLWWGLRVLRGKPCRRQCLVCGIAPVVLLAPLLGFLGMVFPYAAYFFVVNTLTPERISQTAASPDGHHVAYILKKETIGGTGQDYRLSTDGGRKKWVGDTGDYNFATAIHWSPDSSMVIFEKGADLLAVRARDRAVCGVARKQNPGSHDYPPIQSIQFPKPGFFVVSYQDGASSQTVDLDAELLKRKKIRR